VDNETNCVYLKAVMRLLVATAIALIAAAGSCQQASGEEPTSGRAAQATSEAPEYAYTAQRQQMVSEQLEGRDIVDPRVLRAMGKVKRHLFVPLPRYRRQAYADYPLPIGHEQTISQPYIVALMSQLAEVGRGDKVLEVGTGSGYQAAVLAEMGAEVYSIEILEPLANQARSALRSQGYSQVHVRHGDGYQGWPEHAPFDAVVVTAAPPRIPEPLKQQLKVGGKLVVPVGVRYQELVVLTRTEDGFDRRTAIPVRFVPMTGEAQRR